MKGLLSVISIFFIGFCALTGCGPSKAELEAQRLADSTRLADSLHIADSIRLADSIRVADSTRAADSTARVKKAIQFITDMYDNGKYTDYDFLRKHCTDKMLQYLHDNYDYDCESGDCFAVWMFRSDEQDGPDEPNGIVSVEPKGDDWYLYTFYDMGFKGAHLIKIIDQDGQLMIDELKRFQPTK